MSSRKVFGISLHRKFSILALCFGILAGNVVSVPQVLAEEGWQLEEVTVVARRREENLQKAPVAVTAFTADSLQERSISNLEQVARFTANMELNSGKVDGGPSAANATIRGVGQRDNLFPVDPGVGLYLDGIYMGRTLGGNLALGDVERVEVLRGPQGTLYVRNTIGGAINIITPKPTDELGGKLEITAGSYDRLDFNGHVNIPLGIDGLSTRLSAAKIDRDGFVDRPLAGDELGDMDRLVLRGVLGYERDDLDVLLSYDYTYNDQKGSPGSMSLFDANDAAFVFGIYNPIIVPAIAPQLGLDPATQFDGRWVGDFDTSYGTFPAVDKHKTRGTSLSLDWSPSPGLTIKSITAYRELESTVSRDNDHSPIPIAETLGRQNQEQFSQELHIATELFDDRLSLLMGMYYFDEEADMNFTNVIGGYTFQVAPFLAAVLPPVLDAFQAIADVEVESWAGFFHSTYDLTDKLSFTAGLRYTWEEKIYSQDYRNTVLNAQIAGPRTSEESWDAFTPKFGLEYQLNDDSLLYFSASRGFKSGGWDPRAFSDASGENPFDPEFVWTYEIGSKNNFLDNRLLLNATVFYTDYTDIQRQITLQGDQPGVLEIRVFNAAEAEIYGAELEAMYLPHERFELGGAAGYIHAEYSSLEPGVPFSIDDKLEDTPEWTLSLYGQYEHPLGSYGNLTARLDANYRSKTYKEPANLAPLTQPGYWLANARLTFSTHDELWSLSAFVTNLFDEEYITTGDLGPGFGVYETYYGRPREFGVSLSRSF